jgi:hypothetical protein
MTQIPERGASARSPSSTEIPTLLRPAKNALVHDPMVVLKEILDATVSSTIDDLDRASKQRWETSIEPTPQNVIYKLGKLDAGFRAALATRISEIERNPYAFPFDPDRADVRYARMSRRELAWTLEFVVSEVAHLINIVALQPEAQLVEQSASDLEETG